MKKIFALFGGLLSAVGLCAFAACGGEGDGVKTTVTEEEWVNALSYFMVDVDENGFSSGDYPRTNFSCVWDMGEEGLRDLIWSMDYDNNVAYSTPFEGHNVFEEYAWKENDTYYSASDNSSCKYEIMEEDYSISAIFKVYYAGGAWINQYDLLNKYDKFTYSEQSKAYTATIDYTDYEYEYDNGQVTVHERLVSADVAVKFEDGKLMYMETTFTQDESEVTYTFTYTYGITITVPDEYLNLPVAD